MISAVWCTGSAGNSRCFSWPVGSAARTAFSSNVRSEANSTPRPSTVTGPICHPSPSSVPMTMNDDPGVPSAFFVATSPNAFSVRLLPRRSASTPK